MAQRPPSSSLNNYPPPRKKETKICDLVGILINDRVLLDNWSQFCDKLECPTQDKVRWNREIKNGTVQYYNVFSEMLDIWVVRNSHKMTVDNLCRVLRKIECFAVAEILESEFNKDEIIQQSDNSKNSSAERSVFLQNGKVKWPLKHGLFVPTGNFAGREEQLEEIKTNFESKNNLMLITGFGGIGKTELCRKFTYDNYAIPSCVWLHGENLETLRDSVLKLANELGITNEGNPTVSEYFKYTASFILENSNRLLLVIDNVDVGYEEVLKIIQIIRLAKYEKMFVIVTSRDKNVLQGAGITMQLHILSKLQTRRMLQNSMSGLTDSDADKLGELVQYYPLALQQAVGYIKQQTKHFRTPNYSVTDYVNEFEVKKGEMLDQELNKFEFSYSKTTLVTWDMTFCKMSEGAVEILKIISYLDPDGVELEFFEEVCIQMGVVDFDEGLHMLINYCLVKIEDLYSKRGVDNDEDDDEDYLFFADKVISVNKRVSVHRLVQEVMRRRVDNEDYIKILFDSLIWVCWKLFGSRNRVSFSHYVHLKSVFKFAWKCEMRKRLIVFFNDYYLFALDLGRIECAEKLTKLKYPHLQFSSEFGVEKREFLEKVLLWSFVCADSNNKEIAKGEFNVDWGLVKGGDYVIYETLEGCLQISQKYFDESSKITFALKYLLVRKFARREEVDIDRALELCEELVNFQFEVDDGQANLLYETIHYILFKLEKELKSCSPSQLASLEKIMNKIVKTNPNDSKEWMELEASWCDLKGDYKKALELCTKFVQEGNPSRYYEKKINYEDKIIELRIKLTDFDSTTVEEFVSEFGGVDFDNRHFTLRGLENMLEIYELNLGSVHELTINLKMAMAGKLHNGNTTERERCVELCEQVLRSKFDQIYGDAFRFLCWARNIHRDFNERRKILKNLLESKQKELGNDHSNTKVILDILRELKLVN